MPETGAARCHCGAVEIEVTFPSRFCCHCYCFSCRATHASGVVTWIGFNRSQVRWAKGEVHLPLALFVTPVDKAPSLNAFAKERPEWAPFHEFPKND